MAADTYSSYLGAILQGTGNNNNNWGTLANSFVTLLDKAIAGNTTHAVTGGTLSLDGTVPPAGEHLMPEMIQHFTGALAADQVVVLPNVSRLWLVHNATTGSYTLKFKTTTGAASTAIPQGSWQWVACDGANGIALVGPASDATGANLKVLPTVSGNGIVPVGTSVNYHGIWPAPSGWLYEYGQAVSRTTYSLLFDVLTITTTATKNGTTALTGIATNLMQIGLDGAYVEGAGINTGTTITITGATTATLSQAASGAGAITIRILPHGQGDGLTTFNIPDGRGRTYVGRDDMGGPSASRMTGASGGIIGSRLGATGGAQTHTLVTAELASHVHGASGAATAVGDHTHNGTTSAGSGQLHNHNYTLGSNRSAIVGTSGTLVGGIWQGDAGSTTPAENQDLSHAHNFATLGSGTHNHSISVAVSAAGSDSPHNNVQPGRIVNKMIFTGVFT